MINTIQKKRKYYKSGTSYPLFFLSQTQSEKYCREAEFLEVIGTKVLKDFLLAIHRHLQLCLEIWIYFFQTHAISYSFCSSVNVHCKGERRKT
jgi:hypothetical protein